MGNFGRPCRFGRLISLLDPSAIPDPDLREYTADDIKGFFLMRFKEDVRQDAGDNLTDRLLVPLSETTVDATPEEEQVYAILAELRKAATEKQNSGDAWEYLSLLQYGLYKQFLSSPESCRKTVQKRVQTVAAKDAAPELPYLRRMASAMATLTIRSSSRYRLLKRQLQAIGWDGSASSPRVLVFTEYRETQDALAAALAKDFNLSYRDPFETENLSFQHMLKNVGKDFNLSYRDPFEAIELEAVLSQANPAHQEEFLQFLLGETEEAPTPAATQSEGSRPSLLQALGYPVLQPFDLPVEEGTTFVPTLGRIHRYNRPWLVICETHFCLPDGSLKEGLPSEDPLDMSPHQGQLVDPVGHKRCDGDWGRCIGRVFTEEEAPRWVLFLAGSQVLLLDRHTYAQGRYLAFDLDDAFGRKERDTFNHVAAFLAAETLCPGGESDEVLLDRLEEQSHRFAHGVTETLQFAVREAIELLVNEWAYDRTERQRRPLFRLRPDELRPQSSPRTRSGGRPVAVDLPQLDDGSYEITAEHLKREALVFVYRLLFCSYAEARGGELGLLSTDDDAYRLGYSLESLRDLEQIPLTAATEEGTYFHEHLKQLFRLIHQGFHPDQDPRAGEQLALGRMSQTKTFVLRPLTATLFAPESTPLLNRARLSNRCLQAVIRRLSLSTGEKSKTIGRVNYAELGINQLGAVYEGLLSYQGMFAGRDLIYIKPAGGDFRDKKTPTWFVPRERLDELKKDEVERLEGSKPRPSDEPEAQPQANDERGASAPR